MINYIEMTLLITLLAMAVINDLKYYKIKNEINLSFILIGLFLNLYFNTNTNPLWSMAGIITPFIILFPLYALRMLGAGDIKLFCAIGAIMGLYDVLLSIAFSFIFGLLIAVIIMIYRGNFLARFRKLYLYLEGCILTMSIQPYYKLQHNNDGIMHFSIPIALGTVAVNIHSLA